MFLSVGPQAQSPCGLWRGSGHDQVGQGAVEPPARGAARPRSQPFVGGLEDCLNNRLEAYSEYRPTRNSTNFGVVMTLTQHGAQCASSHPAASSLLDGTPASATLSSSPGACSGASSTTEAPEAPRSLEASTPLCPTVAACTKPQSPERWPTARRGGQLSPQWRHILNALLEPAPAVVPVHGETFSARKTQAHTDALALNPAEVNRG